MTTQDIIDHLKAGRPLTKNVAKEIVTELERVKALEEALTWYANCDNWECVPRGHNVTPSCNVERDQGEIARKALEVTCQNTPKG